MSWLDRLKSKSTEDNGPDAASPLPQVEETRPVIAPRRRIEPQEPSPAELSAHDLVQELEEELERALEIDLGTVVPQDEEAEHEQAAVEEASDDEESDPAEDLMQDALKAAREGDYETALSIWEPLARAGNSRAQNNIGACFIDGLGVEQDYELARQWLELSAEDGDPVGRRNLATLCFKGHGGAQDTERAVELFRLAAADGDAVAQDTLSWILLNGESGVKADVAEARHWATTAAAQNMPAAMTRLGMIAYKGIPSARVAADPAEAVQWWRKAARAGDADGQAMLGAAHHSGIGMPRDRVAAYAWLLRAKAGKSPLAEHFIAMVEPTLSPEEHSAAERRASAPLSDAKD